MKGILSVLVVLLSLSADALAHGGSYSHTRPYGPPPGWRPPHDFQHRGGRQFPGVIPTTPRSDFFDPPPPSLRPSAGKPPADPARRRPALRALTHDSWLYWWMHNRFDLLDLRSRENPGSVFTPERVLGVGGTHARGDDSRQLPSDATVAEVLVPALGRMLLSSQHFDLRCAAAIALGKIGSTRPDLAPGISTRLLPLMRGRTVGEDAFVRESAALALGLLQDRHETILVALCDKALERRESETRPRAFAVLALGLLRVSPADPGYEDVCDTLRTAVIAKASREDLPVCALLAMGVSGDAGWLPDLVTMVNTGRAFETRDLKKITRAYAATAIGRLAETCPETTSPVVVSALRRSIRLGENHTRRSAIIALGAIGRRDDLPEIVRHDIARELEQAIGHKDGHSARLAMISYGRMRPGIASASLRFHASRVLNREMVDGQVDDRPFGALALGLSVGSGAGGERTRAAVRRAFHAETGDARNLAAFALSLGLLGDAASGPDLAALLDDANEAATLRGACAVALGMIGDPRDRESIRRVLFETNDPNLRARVAVGAALLGDREIVPALLDILRDPRSSLPLQGSMALALGRIGDRRALEPLVALMLDEKTQDLNRALAAVALGLLADENPVPILGRLSRDMNARARVNSITEVLSIL